MFAKIAIGEYVKRVVCDSDRDSDKRSLVSLAGPATFRVWGRRDNNYTIGNLTTRSY